MDNPGLAPKVSVVIPAYNHEAFVEKALSSAAAQTISDIEIIVIDDCSTDRTPEILEEMSCGDPRITFLRNEKNIGAARTINRGIRRSRGRFIALLNSDDMFHQSRLALLLDMAEDRGLDLVMSDIELVDENGEILRDKTHWWIDWYEDLKNQYVECGDAVATLVGGNMAITTSNFLIRRNVFDDIGLFYDFRYVCDYEFVLRFLADREERFGFLSDERLLYYRLHSSNTIRENALRANRETFEILLKWAPELLRGDACPVRTWRLAEYLDVVEGYIELELQSGFDRKYQEERRKKDKLLQEKDEQIRQLADRVREIIREKDKIGRQRDTTLQHRDELLHEKIGLLQERAGLFNDIAMLRKEILEQNNKIQGLYDEIRNAAEEVRRSASFRLGHAILEPLRLISGMFKHTNRKS